MVKKTCFTLPGILIISIILKIYRNNGLLVTCIYNKHNPQTFVLTFRDPGPNAKHEATKSK